MKREVVDCDKCGAECVAGHIHIDIPNGITGENDGVEHRVYYDYEKKDLCSGCAGKLLGYMFRMKKTCEGSVVTGKDAKVGWVDGRHVHPGPDTNDAVRLALKWFGIAEK